MSHVPCDGGPHGRLRPRFKRACKEGVKHVDLGIERLVSEEVDAGQVIQRVAESVRTLAIRVEDKQICSLLLASTDRAHGQ
eukprot:scaffold4543_cov126-Isochrysis_galbana.AAC.6